MQSSVFSPVRIVLAGALSLIAAGTAHAGKPTVGVEWEYIRESVVGTGDIPTITGGNKELLCSKVQVQSFGRSFDRLKVTYDLILKSDGTEARLEFATGPIPLSDTAAWDGVARSMNAFLKAKDQTLSATLAALQTKDPAGQWAYCTGAGAYAAQIGFGTASTYLNKDWDTQVNMQVGLGQVPLLYRLIEKGQIGLNSVSMQRALEVAGAVKEVMDDDASLTDEERGFLILYFLSRTFMSTGPIAASDHAKLKNKFGLFPKVRLDQLAGAIQVARVQTFITTNEATIFQRARVTNPAADPAFASFTSDHFQVGVVSNPITPYTDATHRTFIVMESRSPNDAMNGYMTLEEGLQGLRLSTTRRQRLTDELGALRSPTYTSGSGGCIIL